MQQQFNTEKISSVNYDQTCELSLALRNFLVASSQHIPSQGFRTFRCSHADKKQMPRATTAWQQISPCLLYKQSFLWSPNDGCIEHLDSICANQQKILTTAVELLDGKGIWGTKSISNARFWVHETKSQRGCKPQWNLQRRLNFSLPKDLPELDHWQGAKATLMHALVPWNGQRTICL
jgi:hypothetical protein